MLWRVGWTVSSLVFIFACSSNSDSGENAHGGAASGGANNAAGARAGGASSGGAANGGASGGAAAGGVTSQSGGSAQGGAATQGGANNGAGTSGGTSLAGASNGGVTGNSGGMSSGGVSANGGTSANGGANSNGGANAAGATASGGKASSGGANSNGGAQSSGGTAGATGSGGSGTASVRIVGRTVTNGANNRFSWPGVNINARFSGTQVSMTMNDGSNKNRYTVVVDGGAPKVITTTGQTSIELASGLSAGNHDLLVWRNTEAYSGVSEFSGLTFSGGGALLPPAAAPDRRIEVIGDSISVGAGVEGTGTCSNIDQYTNNYLAYGTIAARSVNADIVTIAYSGIGVYRSYNGATTMPARYDYAITNDNSAWDFSKYQPHVVVINLGTNDFSSGDPGQPYVDAYVNFAKHVRSKYPNAYFICAAMYGNQETAVNSAVTALKNGGETKIEVLKFNSVQNNLGCNGHPNAAGQKAMGDLLTTRLKAVMSW